MLSIDRSQTGDGKRSHCLLPQHLKVNMSAIDTIRRTLKEADTDLSRFYLEHGTTDLETQAMTTKGGHARITDEYYDYDLRAPLDKIGTNWRNWDTGRCVALALDIDGDDHAGGYTDEQIAAAVASSPPYISWYWSRRGKGVTGIVLMDAPAPTRADQSELGKRLRQKLTAEWPAASMIDVIGGNCWVWWSGATGRAHMLIRAATTSITADDLPELTPAERTTDKSALTGLPASLSAKQRDDLEILRTEGRCAPRYEPSSGAYPVHTCDLHLIDSSFRTISPGTDPSSPNAFMFPVGDGSWRACRYAGAAEHESWTHRDGKTWTILNPHLEHDFDFSVDYRPLPESQPPVTASLLPMPLVTLTSLHPTKSEPLIDGLIRLGETMNIIAPPKCCKSWLTYYKALCIVTGRMLFRFATRKGKVLLLDNELHPAIIVDRIARVATEMGIPASEYGDMIHVCSLRGRLLDLPGIERQIIDQLEGGTYAAVICDAWYRFSPGGRDGENSNSGITQAFNSVDRMAAKSKAAWILIHHSSKGDQSSKSVVDVGSGAGAQSRAADCHVVLREHELPDTVVMEAKVRSFPPVQPIVLEWHYPLWRVIDADPTALKKPNSKRVVLSAEEIAAQQAEELAEREHHKAIVLTAISSEDHTDSSLKRRLTGSIQPAMLIRLLNDMLTEGKLARVRATKYGKPCDVYRLV